MNRCGLILLHLADAEGNGDGHGSLDGEDIFALACATPLATKVENPDFIAQAAHVLANPAKSVAVKVARRANETDDARTRGGLMLEDLPQRPAPEIYVQVVEVLNVNSVA